MCHCRQEVWTTARGWTDHDIATSTLKQLLRVNSQLQLEVQGSASSPNLNTLLKDVKPVQHVTANHLRPAEDISPIGGDHVDTQHIALCVSLCEIDVKANITQMGPVGFEDRQGTLEDGLDIRGAPVDEVASEHTEPIGRTQRSGRPTWVCPAWFLQCSKPCSDKPDVRADQANMVNASRQDRYPRGRDAPKGRLQTDHPAKRRRRPHRTRSVRTHGKVDNPGPDRSSRPGRRPSRPPLNIVRVQTVTEELIAPLRATREFAQVGLTNHDHSRGSQPLHYRCVAVRNPVDVQTTPPRCAQPGGINIVLDRYRNPVEGAQRTPIATTPIRRSGRRQRALSVDRNEGIYAATTVGLSGIERGLRRRHRSHRSTLTTPDCGTHARG